MEKENQLVDFDYQNVYSLCLHHHYVNSSYEFCVSIDLHQDNADQAESAEGEGREKEKNQPRLVKNYKSNLSLKRI